MWLLCNELDTTLQVSVNGQIGIRKREYTGVGHTFLSHLITILINQCQLSLFIPFLIWDGNVYCSTPQSEWGKGTNKWLREVERSADFIALLVSLSRVICAFLNLVSTRVHGCLFPLVTLTHRIVRWNMPRKDHYPTKKCVPHSSQ